MKPALRNSLLSPFIDFVNDDLFNVPFFWSTNLPAVNIREDVDRYQLEVVAPGLKKEDFKLTMDDGTLTISAENMSEAEQNLDNYRRKEYTYQSFSRSFSLPDNPNRNEVKADYKEGVLTIELKKNVNEPKEKMKLIPVG